MVAKNNIIKVIENIISEDDISESPKRKILLVATECAPYAAVGGISSVIVYLSRALMELGHDVRVFIPKYGSIDEKEFKTELVYKGLKVPTSQDNPQHLICNVKIANSQDGVPTYLLENQEYYEKRANVYGYSDDPTRWALLSRGVLEFIKTGEFVPDVIHCNDWHTGILPNYLNTLYSKDSIFENITTVFTIHNLGYQGNFDHHHVSELDYDDGKSEIAAFFDPRLSTQNFMRRGILYSDVVNTVSRNYAREIMTEQYGEGLDKLLLEVKDKVFGIINGLDYDVFNPSNDELIQQNYDIKSLDLRVENKLALQEEFGLAIDKEIPMLGFVGRLDFQKGIDLMVKTLGFLLKNENVQFVQVGGGDPHLASLLQDLKQAFPDKVGVHTYPNFTLPRLLFSGCDMILYPSRFEPCGVVQLEAMRYGSIPIVRDVGGLSDTVKDFDAILGAGNGFVFKEFETHALYGAIVKAIYLFNNKKLWKKLQINAMKADFSWSFSAKEYVKLYTKSKSFRKAFKPFARPRM